MSAALLRLAADKMRQEAQLAAIGGRGDHWRTDFEFLLQPATAAHVTAWSPTVALAVADWLETTARELASLGDPDLSAHPQDGRRTAALKVARAHLGAEVDA